MKYAELLQKAQHIKSQINELRTEAYSECIYHYDNADYFFYASFDLDAESLVFNIVREGFEVKLIADLPADVICKFTDFIRAHQDWVDGNTSEPRF